MALPALSNFVTWSGSLFNKNSWDSNIQTLVNIFSGGSYDMNIAKLTCTDITANSINLNISNGIFVGFVTANHATVTPSGWLPYNGANRLIASYPDLFYFYGHTYGNGDGTPVTANSFNIVGNVCTITENAHGLANDQYCSVKFTDVASGKVINRGVKISNVTTNTFDFSIAGWVEQPQGTIVYTQATTFPVGDMRGRFERGIDTTASIDPDAASRTDRGDGTTGAQVGTLQEDVNKAHNHNILAWESGPSSTSGNRYINWDTVLTSVDYDSTAAHYISHPLHTGISSINDNGGSESRPVNVGVNYIVFSGV